MDAFMSIVGGGELGSLLKGDGGKAASQAMNSAMANMNQNDPAAPKAAPRQIDLSLILKALQERGRLGT